MFPGRLKLCFIHVYALSITPQPIVLFGRPKEGDFYPTQLRDDYALVDDDGTIIHAAVAGAGFRFRDSDEEAVAVRDAHPPIIGRGGP
jgi:hypothetical protein